MGKKMGMNTKAVEARERKDAQKKAKNEAIEKKKEDEYWKDDDKHINRKIDRQRERDNKVQEEKERKAALKAAYEKDMEAAEEGAKSKAAKKSLESIPKVTRATIRSNFEVTDKQLTEQVTKKLNKVSLAPMSLVPNLNRIEADGENATSVDQALEVLKPKQKS